jgi:hypothetical protein
MGIDSQLSTCVCTQSPKYLEMAQGHISLSEADSENEDDDDGILSPSKPNHIEFGKSTVKAEDMVLMKKLGYFWRE